MTNDEKTEALFAALRAAQREVEARQVLVDYWEGRAKRAEAEIAGAPEAEPEWVGGHGE